MLQQLLQYIQTNLFNTSFINPDYLVDDIFFLTNLCLGICVFIFFINFSNPFVLILTLEIMYLFLNINFIMAWVFLQYFNGLVYVLLIIGIAGAETIVGLIIVVKLYNTQSESFYNMEIK